MASDPLSFNATPDTPHLKRGLSLVDLILYGFVITSPTPAPQLGNAQIISHGHTVTTLLIAMIPMALTAVSFGDYPPFTLPPDPPTPTLPEA